MLGKLYARWMYAWETALTTRDTNRIVRPVEWGFEWLAEFAQQRGLDLRGLESPDHGTGERVMLELNDLILRNRREFFSYATPQDFTLEERHPQLFPTNVRPETLQQDAMLRRRAAEGKLPKAQFLRFTSPVRTPYPENDRVNARWYPAPPEKMAGKPRQAIIVMPQWNADAFSHNALCSAFNRFGVSALRLSKPFHDIRRPAELERADYAVSANVGRTLAACRQAVIDIRCCVDWLVRQGYEQFGILGTSLGSCYAFLASAMDSRLQVNAFNHASMTVGDVVWTGQSTRHIREAFAGLGMTRERLRALWAGVSPANYMDEFAANPKKVLVVHATYDLTFLPEYSLQVIESFRSRGVDFISRVLPCGHYTTGETPYKFMDGWYLGAFVYSAFKQLAGEGAARSRAREDELAAR
ncbi:MAG TPA: abhydrolase domain-containing 18 [Acidobacteriaceae bacterium]|nr:abhydrolase domain-containing 18 [Acidobacteriaceae bacterium]